MFKRIISFSDWNTFILFYEINNKLYQSTISNYNVKKNRACTVLIIYKYTQFLKNKIFYLHKTDWLLCKHLTSQNKKKHRFKVRVCQHLIFFNWACNVCR